MAGFGSISSESPRDGKCCVPFTFCALTSATQPLYTQVWEQSVANVADHAALYTKAKFRLPQDGAGGKGDGGGGAATASTFPDLEECYISLDAGRLAKEVFPRASPLQKDEALEKKYAAKTWQHLDDVEAHWIGERPHDLIVSTIASPRMPLPLPRCRSLCKAVRTYVCLHY